MNNIVHNIKIDKYPLLIVTDIHGNLFNLQRLLNQYSDYQVLCLGDIVDLWDKDKTNKNQKITDFFIEKKIPCVQGNHDEWVGGNKQLYNITNNHEKYLVNLPQLIVLDCPDNKSYKCYHYRPNDFWSVGNTSDISYDELCQIYGYSDFEDGIITGHVHKSYIKEFPNKRRKHIIVGALKYGEYALLNENGIEFKKL